MSLGIGPHDLDCQCARCKSRRQASAIPEDDLTRAYLLATELAMRNGQTTGEDNQYFVTLRQLESIFLRIKEK